jgi:hypothetical protein
MSRQNLPGKPQAEIFFCVDQMKIDIRDTAEKGSVIFHELYLKLARGRDSLHFKTQIIFR